MKCNFICQGLVRYQEEFPFYFKIALEKINIDFDKENYLPECLSVHGRVHTKRRYSGDGAYA